MQVSLLDYSFSNTLHRSCLLLAAFLQEALLHKFAETGIHKISFALGFLFNKPVEPSKVLVPTENMVTITNLLTTVKQRKVIQSLSDKKGNGKSYNLTQTKKNFVSFVFEKI